VDASHRSPSGAGIGVAGVGLLSAVIIAAAVALWLSSPSRDRVASVVGELAPKVESPSRMRRKRRKEQQHDAAGSLLAQAPIVADLLATAIAAGATVPEAMSVVAQAVGEPMRARLRAVITAMDMGADPHSAWSSWLDEPALSPIAQAIIRSQHSGSPLSTVLDAAAADMRQAYRADVEARARAAGVRAVAPLALCYLPAYLLVGVVPVVAGFASALFG
jgi:pilus assembly protein TadC